MQNVKCKIPIALIYALLTLVSSAWAKDLSFVATVDQTRVALDGQITLTLTVTGEGLGGVPDPTLPAMNDLAIAGTNSSSSTQISFVNGSMTATKTVEFIYALRPMKVGTFTIGAASIQVEGKTYATDPIQVEVVPGGAGGGGRGGIATPSQPGSSEVAELEKNLFLEVTPDRRQVYVGEQVTLLYKLFTRYGLQNVQYSKVPTYTGFWAEALFDAQQLNFQQEVRNGKAFNTALLKRVALFSTTAGSKTLDEMDIGCDIPVRSRGGPFDDFEFFGRAQRVTLRSDPLKIEVLPLPPGAPAGFRGAVGSYSVTASVTPRSVTEGDPISMKMTLSGTGNLDAVTEPGRPESRDFKVYDPKVSKAVEKTGNRIGGSKTFEYVIIPERAGQVILPPFEFVYFDPQKRQYATVASAPIPISVSPGKRLAEGEGHFRLSREEVTQEGRDIRYIKPDAEYLEDQGRALYQGWGFLSLQALPFLGLAGALAYRRHLERLRGDVAYARRRRSMGEAARRLKAARQIIEEGRGPEFHAEVYRALSQFLADRLNVPAAGLTTDAVLRHLEARQVEAEVSQWVRDIFEQCNFARFAPSTIQAGEMERLYEETEAVIEALERKI
ncbi:MAG: protein BatD [Candidatus Latescibacteria bacterium]|nr:protein BatD [Candidatus Latescibacterota bacterium]